MTATPIWFVTPESWDAVRDDDRRTRGALRASLRVRAQARPHAACAGPRRRPRRRAVRRGPGRPAASRQARHQPAARRISLRRQAGSSADLATLAFLLARYRFERLQGRAALGADAGRRRRRTVERIAAADRRRPRSRQSARQRADALGAGARGASRLPTDSAPRSSVIAGDELAAGFPLDRGGRRGGVGAAAAGRFHLGPGRTRPR